MQKSCDLCLSGAAINQTLLTQTWREARSSRAERAEGWRVLSLALLLCVLCSNCCDPRHRFITVRPILLASPGHTSRQPQPSTVPSLWEKR